MSEVVVGLILLFVGLAVCLWAWQLGRWLANHMYINQLRAQNEYLKRKVRIVRDSIELGRGINPALAASMYRELTEALDERDPYE